MSQSVTRRRSPWYRAVIVGATVVTAALVVSVAVQTADLISWRSLASADASTVGTGPARTDSAVKSFDDVVELREIVVKVNGEITIAVDEKATAVTVRKTAIAGLSKPTYAATLSDSRLAVTGHCNALLFNSSSMCKISVEITLPANLTHATVRLTSEVGSVSVTDLSAGRLEAKSDLGDISIANIVGDVEASSSTGWVAVKDIDGNLWADSDTGAVAAQSITGSAKVTSDVGEVSVRGVAGDASAFSATGAVSVCEANANVEALSDLGDILVRAPKDGVPVRLDHTRSLGRVTLEGLTDSTADNTVTVRSNTGSIRFLPYDAGPCGEL